MSGVEVREATAEECLEIAARDIRKALAELDKIPTSHEAAHVHMYLQSALIWLGA